jgi:hypothetical protein
MWSIAGTIVGVVMIICGVVLGLWSLNGLIQLWRRTHR